ncbi:acetyl-CoA carboxylase biotin carboxyl carrier protein [Blattabacterium cuenoti]|uniref:acetyl-CoA carboxylase biotin carboxyl carrier protein n=1 Tax=Blattabacterium cuenoti TaxID=1653831 RepID=UPI00293BE4C7|nr:acetyl-CoA carboxylase biotin carboxyl carrier protein [Blattabacterium cuenoti]
MIKSLIQIVSKSNINEIKIQIGEIKIYIKNKKNNFKKNKYHTINKSFFKDHQKENNKKSEVKHKNLVTIRSPIIGTFYRKPHPNKEPFVEVGDIIKIGMKICIIEAMKLFNNVESEVNGKLLKIFVEDATPVDYDQPLFLLETDY